MTNHSASLRLSILAAALASAVTVGATESGASAERIPRCATGSSSAELTVAFSSGESGLVGGDYGHAYPLPDGRTLWIFQDSFVGAHPTSTLSAAHFSHNAALLQEGLCFRLLGNGRSRSYLGGDAERRLRHWFWPLDGEIGADGKLHVFAAEFINANGTGAANGATPVAVWQAVIRPSDLSVESFGPAPDSTARPLFGFSVASDAEFSYLYGNCYEQFTKPSAFGAADVSCNLDVYLARVPRGRFDLDPSYWNGRTWVADRSAAVTVSRAGTFANPLQVEPLDDGRFVAASHVDDWWGSSVTLYVAARPTGPFVRYAEVEVAPRCDPECNTYSASFTPGVRPDGIRQLIVSTFTWDFAVANATPVLYRPIVIDAPAPPARVPHVPAHVWQTAKWRSTNLVRVGAE